MAGRYYLIDGKPMESKAIYVPYKGEYYKDFQDISFLDNATISLGKDINSKLDECNPDLKLDHIYYDILYPFKNDLHKPIKTFIYKEEMNKMIDKFMPFVEERIYKVEQGKKLELDNSNLLKEYIDYLLGCYYSLDLKGRTEMMSLESTMSKGIKNQISNRNKYNITSILTGYTELRNFTLMYMDVKLKSNLKNRTLLNTKGAEQIKGLTPEDPKEIKKYLEYLKSQALEAKEQNKNIDEGQMSLGDVFPEYNKYINENKKRTRVKNLLDN